MSSLCNDAGLTPEFCLLGYVTLSLFGLFEPHFLHMKDGHAYRFSELPVSRDVSRLVIPCRLVIYGF